jgi:type IV pilus assembly protein PilQ
MNAKLNWKSGSWILAGSALLATTVLASSPISSESVSVKTVYSIEEDPLEMASKTNEKKFTGTPITLKLKDADVHEVLRLISEASGFNIVIHPSVNGKLTLALERVPWDQALEVVLTTLKLAAERSDSVLRVMPREMFIAEKQAELESKRIAATAAPRVTRIFPISYADPQQISTLLTSFVNAQNTGPGASGLPTTIIVDQNTQSLIVRETTENIDRIRKMIELLDVQTPQVLIEGKVIEASSDFSKSINGGIAAGGTQLGSAFNTQVTSLVGTPVITPIGSAGTGTFRAASGLTIFDRPIFLNAFLELGEKESSAKVVSSPRTVVLSGKSATITQAKSVAIQASITTPTGGTQTQLQTITANTRLNVTPRVTNDGSVFMKIDVSRDILNQSNSAAPVTEPRNMSTEVIVDSGNTLVIGGILNLDETHLEEGFPVLRKIPLLGWLFGKESNSNIKSEVMFFVTPRVLNPRKSGNVSADQAEAQPEVQKM